MKTQIKLFNAIVAFYFVFQGITAQDLYTKIGTDKPWEDIIRDGDIPVGSNSTKGIKGSRIDVKNNLVEKGPYANFPIEQNIDIHAVGNGRIPREDFDKWSRWYQEDGNTQVFRLHKGEHNVRNTRPGKPRIEAESRTTWEEGEWHEWVGRYTIVEPTRASLFQIFADPVGDRGGTGIMIIEMTAGGEVYWNKRNGKDRRTFLTNAKGKSFDLRVRDNGYTYEVYINGAFFETHSIEREAGKKTHFRWGIYAPDNMPHDAMVFVTGATVDPKSIPNAIGPEGYTYAVNESETVEISDVPYDVAYGQDGEYEYLLEQRADVNCNNTTFGNDPVPGTSKYCFIRESKVPYTKDPTQLPGIIEAENFDFGGQGRSYLDADPENRGDIGFREESGVDIDKGANGIGYAVGWMSTGEWLEYTVNVIEDGMYNFNFSVASPNGTGILSLDVDGEKLIPELQVPQTGGWDMYTSFDTNAQLSQGTHVIRLQVENNGFNLDKITISTNPLSINDLTKKRIYVYPNPSETGIFRLSTKIPFQIYSITGKEVLNAYSDQVDLSTFSKGIYILRSENFIEKLIN